MTTGFAHPELLPLLLAGAACVALAGITLARRWRAAATFGGRGAGLASASRARQRIKLGLLAVACVAIAVAIAGPEIGEQPRRAAAGTVDTVIALDVSQSMGVQDVAPDRLHAAERAVEALGRELAGGRVGLVLFAGSSVVRYPLSADTKVLGPSLDASGRGFKINPGSSLRSALQAAGSAFGSDPTNRPKAIVVVSDGEDLAPDLPAIEPLRQRNISVFTIGVGTPQGGSVPIYDQKGKLLQMVVDANGTQVTSRLDEARLRTIAEQGGGKYLRYDGPGTTRAIADALRAIDPETTIAQSVVSPEDRYQIFLAVAVVALLVDWLVDERRPMPRPRTPRVRVSPRRRILALLGAALLFMSACGASDPLADQVDAANALLDRDPAGALARYRDVQGRRPTSPEVAVDVANALSRLGEFERALVEYAHALDTATGKTRAIAFYDRGNALFRLGRVAEARASYVEALRLDPTDRDAKFNVELIDKLIGQVQAAPGSASPPPGAPTPPAGATQRPGASSDPTGASGPGTPDGTPPPGASGTPGGTPPPTVQSALTDFRKDLTVDDALRLLDALRGEQRGLEGLIEGTAVRRGGNLDVPY